MLFLCALLRNTAVDTVEQELLFVGTENGKLLAMRDIIKKVGRRNTIGLISDEVLMIYYLFFGLLLSGLQGFLPPMLVFVQSIDRARELFHELVYEGINVDVIHADRTQQQVRLRQVAWCSVSLQVWPLTFAVVGCCRETTWWTVSAPGRFGCWSARRCSPEESTSKASTSCSTTTSPPAPLNTSTASVSACRTSVTPSIYSFSYY